MYSLDDTLDNLLGDRTGNGINAMYRCPLHEDKHPSLSANREEGLWKCHSCGASGGITWLAHLVGADLGEDFEWDRAIASVQNGKPPPAPKNFKDKANDYYYR